MMEISWVEKLSGEEMLSGALTSKSLLQTDPFIRRKMVVHNEALKYISLPVKQLKDEINCNFKKMAKIKIKLKLEINCNSFQC